MCTFRRGGGHGALDDNVTVDGKEQGVTSLHLFNMAVQDLQQIHDQIAKDKQRAAGKKLRETSTEIFTLKKQLRKPGLPEAKQDIADRITHLQHELSSVLEARDTASTMRIRNFYKTARGKTVPETFHCIFLIVTKPLNRILATCFWELMYSTEEGVVVGSLLYADDNLTPMALTGAEQLQLVLSLYDEYTGVSGLNINIAKTTALCINSSDQLCEGLRHMGMTTPDNAKHLGILLGKTMDSTVEVTMASIEPKLVKRRILATTPPTDVLHRATLVTTALILVYNHVFMALPVEPKHTEPLFSEILRFLWTKQVDGHIKQKRRLVARRRISAGLEMGGLGIQHPDEIIQGFQLNLLQKIHKQGRAQPAGNLPSILTGLLARANRPSLAEHILRLGPKQWKITGQRLLPWNRLLGLAFHSAAVVLASYETTRDL